MATLHVLTSGACKGASTGCHCRSCTTGQTRIVAWRTQCDACNGNTERCLQGQGQAGDFARLDGCAAFTEEGKIRPRKAKTQPRQPWEPARTAA